MGGVGAEVGQAAGVEEGLALAPGGQAGAALRFDRPVQGNQQVAQGARQQQLLVGHLLGQGQAVGRTRTAGGGNGGDDRTGAAGGTGRGGGRDGGGGSGGGR